MDGSIIIWWRPQDGVAFEPWTAPPADPEMTPVAAFGADFGGTFVATDPADAIAQGWPFDGKAFSAPVVAPPTAAALLAYADVRQATVLAQVWRFTVAGIAAPLTTRLDPLGEGAMQSLALWGILNSSSSTATEAYTNDDWSPATLTPSQALSLVTQAGGILSQSRAVLMGLANGITGVAGAAPVTSFAQIDSAAWPVPAAAA